MISISRIAAGVLATIAAGGAAASTAHAGEVTFEGRWTRVAAATETRNAALAAAFRDAGPGGIAAPTWIPVHRPAPAASTIEEAVVWWRLAQRDPQATTAISLAVARAQLHGSVAPRPHLEQRPDCSPTCP